MSDADMAYPLLCPTGCGYNFCYSCAEHLVNSSKQDYEMASDGNRHVKVQLQCPQCRGDLQHTIHDTLILRRAKNTEKYNDIKDSELNATELRDKHAHASKEEIEEAEARLRKFHKDHADRGDCPEPLRLDSQNGGDSSKEIFLDTTLFQGLEFAMSNDEQRYVQKLLTSGEAQNLANAAQILDGIFQLMMQGLATTKSVVERSRNEERRHIEAMDIYKKRCPLPAKLPKYFTLLPKKKSPILFGDDQWDGSIEDAFTRTNKTGEKKRILPGIQNIMASAEQTHLEPKARVKITSIKGQAGRIGLQVGDVVSHINGEPFIGLAEDLRLFVEGLQDTGETFQMVVNADDATAEVLRLRSEMSEKEMNDAFASIDDNK